MTGTLPPGPPPGPGARAGGGLVAPAGTPTDPGLALGAGSPRPLGPAVQRGTLIAGRYRLARPISTGPRTTLWRAVDEVLARPVAVKVLDRARGDGPLGAAFLDAAARAGAVLHPGLARVDDAALAETPDGHRLAYVVSEWLPGLPLSGLLRDGPLDVDDAVAVVRRCAEALAAAHAAGVPHLALHPGQVVVDAELRPVVTDLAVAAALVGRRPTGTTDGRVAAADARADTAGLGALLYAAVTARWPAGPDHGLPGAPRAAGGEVAAPRQVRGGVPRDLDAVTTRALDPRRRAGQAPLDTPARLERALRVLPPTRRPPRRRRSVPGWVRRAGVVGGALAGLGAVGLTAYTLGLVVGEVPDQEERLPGLPLASPAPRGASAAPAASAAPVPVAAVVDFDPEGDGREQPGLTRLAVDADPSSAWQTSRYASPDLGGLKSGVGLLLDLGQARAVRSVTVQTGLPGAALELRSAGDTAPTSIAGTRVVATSAGLAPTTELAVPAGTPSRWWVLWLTRLPEVPGGYRGAVSEVLFRATG